MTTSESTKVSNGGDGVDDERVDGEPFRDGACPRGAQTGRTEDENGGGRTEMIVIGDGEGLEGFA